MTKDYRSAGKTTLTPDVFLTIARQAALEVDGVYAMARVKGKIRDWLGQASDGVRLKVEDNIVFVDLFLILDSEVNIREVSRNVQLKVARTITELTGLEAGHINIHIEDIHYKSEE